MPGGGQDQESPGEEANTYIYVGTSNLAMADRGAAHLRDSRRGMQVTFDKSHMARLALEMHPGEEPRFGVTVVRTKPSLFKTSFVNNSQNPNCLI